MLNSDVILDPGSIEKMVADFDHPEIGVVGMKLRFPELKEHLHGQDDAGKIQHVGLATSIRGDFYHLFIGWDLDHPKVNAVRKVLAVTGAALMTRRSLWIKVKGFNPVYGFGTYEDVEYCLAVQAIDKEVIVEIDATGIHFTNATAKEYNIGYPLQQNNMLMKSRWGSSYPWTSWLHH
jgi:GT2 family glycosyltransferase